MPTEFLDSELGLRVKIENFISGYKIDVACIYQLPDNNICVNIDHRKNEGYTIPYPFLILLYSELLTKLQPEIKILRLSSSMSKCVLNRLLMESSLCLYERDCEEKLTTSAMEFRGVGNVNEISRAAILVCSSKRYESGNSDKCELESPYTAENNSMTQDLKRWQQQRPRYYARLKSRHEEVCLYANTVCDESIAKMARKQSFSFTIFEGIWSFCFNILKDYFISTKHFAREESGIQYSMLDCHITYEPFDFDEARDIINNRRCNVSCTKIVNWRRSTSLTAMCRARNASLLPFFQCVQKIHKLLHLMLLMLLMLTQVVRGTHASLLDTNFTRSDLALLAPDSTSDLISYSRNYSNSSKPKIKVYSDDINSQLNGSLSSFSSHKGAIVSPVSSSVYLEKLDSLERSLAAVLIKVAYGTTSTTKRSIPDNSNVPSLTTIATPLLTTLRESWRQNFCISHLVPKQGNIAQLLII
uniref:Uncharacterized protein n=1 Tax=Glossina austeni TaxID=7395 RepID=A0A1A9V3K7_GLOAU